MGNLVHLHGDPHEQTSKLLPWYVNDTLDEAEAAMVDAHLAECSTCRAEAGQERALRRDVASLALDSDHGWAAMRQKLAAAETRPAVRPAFWHRRVRLGWAVAGQLAAAAIAAIVLVSLEPAKPDGSYRALGTAPVAAPGNAIVLFGPRTSAAQIRDTLAAADARVTDGPLASGGYLLRVPAADRPRRLEQLRAAAGVVMAEPIDAPQPR